MWVRGLKHRSSREALRRQIVAPYVGAWIETWAQSNLADSQKSHPMWVRGLKQFEFSHVNELLSRTLCGCVD